MHQLKDNLIYIFIVVGIDANCVGIDDELEKDLAILDDCEKEDEVVDESPMSNVISNDVHISEGDDLQQKSDVIYSSKTENKDNCELNRCSGESECYSSSNMNLVYDEVEIGTEATDEDALAECTKNLNDPICDVVVINNDDNTEKTSLKKEFNPEDEKNIIIESEGSKQQVCVTDKQSKDISKSIETSSANSCTKKVGGISTSLEKSFEEEVIPTSQNSDSSIEWLVLDSVYSEEDVNLSQDNVSVKNNTTESENTEADTQLKDSDASQSSTIISTGIYYYYSGEFSLM